MSDSYVRMSYADSGQPQFSNWQAESLGEVGEYGKRVVFTRLGQFRQRVIRIQVSSRRKRDLIGVVWAPQPTDG